MKTAIAYYSKKGFVEEAARRLADSLGNSASLWDIHSGKGTALEEADVVVLASSVHAGHFSGKFRKTCRKWIPLLENRKVVLLVGGLDDKEYVSTVEKNLSRELSDRIWKIVYAGGRYIPENHGPFIRKLMAKINQSEGPIHKEKWENLEALAGEIKSL